MLWFNIARQMDIALALESEFDLLVDSEVEVELRLFDLTLKINFTLFFSKLTRMNSFPLTLA